MSSVVVARSDVTVEEVADVLRHGLGDRYDVIPGQRMTLIPAAPSDAPAPDTILVQAGLGGVVRAQVTLVRRGSDTQLAVRPGGLLSMRLVNAVGIGRKIHRVLAAAAWSGGH